MWAKPYSGKFAVSTRPTLPLSTLSTSSSGNPASSSASVRSIKGVVMNLPQFNGCIGLAYRVPFEYEKQMSGGKQLSGKSGQVQYVFFFKTFCLS